MIPRSGCFDHTLRSLLARLPRSSLATMDHSSSVKRKKSQEDLSGATTSKKARKRVTYALFTPFKYV